MTVSTLSNKVVLQGNSSTTSWPFPFRVDKASYLSVIVTDANGDQQTINPSLYSIAGVGNKSGGSVTYPLSGDAVPLGSSVTVLRSLPLTQLTDITNQSGFYPDVHEAVFDALTMMSQQLAERQSRAVSFPVSDDGTANELPAAAARLGKVMVFDPSTGAADTSSEPYVEPSVAADNAKHVAEQLVAGVAPGSGTGTFIQDGIGSIVRTFQSKMRERLSPADKGAIDPTGLTDSTAAFNALFASLQANTAVTIEIPRGTYLLNPIDITLPLGIKLTVIANGVQIMSTNTGTVPTVRFRGDPSASILVAGLQIDHVTQPNYLNGNGTAETEALSFVQSAGQTQGFGRVICNNVRISSAWWCGIRHSKCLETYTDNCKMANLQGAGIFGGGQNIASATRCGVNNTSDDGIAFFQSSAVPGVKAIVSGNFIDRTGAKGAGAGGYLQTTISDNIVSNSLGHGIFAYTGPEGNSGTGDIWANIEQVSMVGNKVRGTGSGGNRGAAVAGTSCGIYIRGGTDPATSTNYVPASIVMIGNDVRMPQEQACRIDCTSSLKMSGNALIALTGLALLIGSQTLTLPGSLNLRMSNNELITTTGVQSVQINTATNVSLRENTISANGSQAAVLFRGCTTVEASNTFLGTSARYSNSGSTGVRISSVGVPLAYASGASADATYPAALYQIPTNAEIGKTEVRLGGKVTLTGAVAAVQNIMNMGSTYQPPVALEFPVVVFDGTNLSTALLEIQASGNAQVRLRGAPSGTVGLFLDGITYLV